MIHVLVSHTVESYDRWKPHFDDHASTRGEHGERGYHLFRGTRNPNEVVVLFEWDSEEHAREFIDSSDLRRVMREAGVVGRPDVRILDEVETRLLDESTA